MEKKMLNRSLLNIRSLKERENKVHIEKSAVDPDTPVADLDKESEDWILKLVRTIVAARKIGSSRILSFGAHTIKNGLSPVLQALIEEGWITHLATNGAGIIHDWEFAYQGKSSEDVRKNVAAGKFGIWEETGFYINTAIALGAYLGLGYGESVGSLVEKEELDFPSKDDLFSVIQKSARTFPERSAAAADLLLLYNRIGIDGRREIVPHPYKRYGLQAAAFRNNIPFTGHPMFGHDIIYNHPANLGAAIGRTAERDFLSFADSVAALSGGVYLSVGSAVMSPMIFEKSLSMAMNIALQQGKGIQDHSIYVVDLAKASWNWSRDGEPPQNHPAYYLRFMKTFHRMGGDTNYLSIDNRVFLLKLLKYLRAS